LSTAGKTIILVTHDDDLAKRAQRVLKLVDGKMINDKKQNPITLIQPER
jgi:putative ABC transport system ATP-binding protein